MNKKYLRGRLALVLSVLLMLSNCFTVFGAEHWAQASVDSLKQKQIIKEEKELNVPINRGEVMKLLNRVFNNQKKSNEKFQDVKSDSPYAEEVSKAVAAGYIKGYEDQTIKPLDNITRQEMITVLCKAFQIKTEGKTIDAVPFVDKDAIGTWARSAVGALYEQGIIHGDVKGNFRPQSMVTYAEVYKMIDLLSGTVISTKGTYSKNVEGNVVINAPGVKLKDMKISGNLYLSEGIGSGDVTLENVEVKGNVIVSGGGENSVHVTDSLLLNVIINKKDGTVRIVAHGDTKVYQLDIQTPAIVQEENVTGPGFTRVLLSNLLPQGSNVQLSGSFDTVEVLAHTVKVDIPQGKIENLLIGKEAVGAQLQLGRDSLIEKLLIEAAASILGNGQVKQATVSSSGVKFENAPQNVVIGEGGERPTITNRPNSNTNNGGGGGSESSTNFDFTLAPAPMKHLVVSFDTREQISYDPQATTAGSIKVTVTIDGQVVPWQESSYTTTSAQLKIHVPELFKDENVGKQLVVRVEGQRNLVGTVTRTVAFVGFAGRVHDVNNVGVPNATIQFRLGIGTTTGNVVKEVKTDAQGNYGVFMQPGSYTGTMIKPGYISSNYLIATAATNKFNLDQTAVFIEKPIDGQMRIVLRWGDKVRDIDSHLYAELDNGDSYHTAYWDKEAYDPTHQLYADLDWDDVDYYGPETTTIRQLEAGTYKFYVHNFSQEKDIITSNAKVEVYMGGTEPVYTQSIPTNPQGRLFWNVFEMTVDGSGKYTIHNNNVLSFGVEGDNKTYAEAYDYSKVGAIYPAITTPGGYVVDDTFVSGNNIVPEHGIQQDYVKMTTTATYMVIEDIEGFDSVERIAFDAPKHLYELHTDSQPWQSIALDNLVVEDGTQYLGAALDLSKKYNAFKFRNDEGYTLVLIKFVSDSQVVYEPIMQVKAMQQTKRFPSKK